ncbi:phosphoinositide phosphatase SAC2 isoform X1 [Cryptomeria japonica]|uniref:phosphoinositide phosphatase SAC2 isoform X1 n=2 Tax=Cryptomeria japonica TaxID=3369 RepID=UPI0027D9FA3B|nr:phosphoinositide phosphatase SAC2 isoform X1 [Cryptomeria japonica]
MSLEQVECCADGCDKNLDDTSYSLQKFKLYETRSNFYMLGKDKRRAHWRVLKIDRLDPSELIIREDPTIYTKNECQELLHRIDEGNKSTGGLNFVTKCYGIVGFIKFLEPYYMILIKKRRQIGDICGHAIFGITESQLILVPHPTVRTNLAYCKDEQSYKKLLSTVDITKDFFFSYTYNVTRSLQKNLCNDETEKVLFETMFVWNEFLTQRIRNSLNNTLWTVALAYGFFKQAKLLISGKQFSLTLIARRSRHYAGTRYLKRGVNDKGRVANDVETEQIVFEDVSEESPRQICSVVQHRGSIPLYWSQETSRLNLKPDIILQKKDPTYQATKLHFENLVKRYGNPIIVLNLIKGHEKKPRESILCAEFAHAVKQINKDLPEDSQLKFIHWDLHKFFRSKSANVLQLLANLAVDALDRTGFFYSWITSDMKIDKQEPKNNLEDDNAVERCTPMVCDDPNEKDLEKKPLFQRGVLRTNCIDCLDRTNVAQYAYGLVALGRQLHALGMINMPEIESDSRLSEALMGLYETMGDTLALQYGGSAAHNKVFSERRGRWRAATNSQEFFRSLQRYYSNAYMDAEKQDAINVFLGYFQPQQGKPALWELDSDQHCNIGRRIDSFVNDNARSDFKRCLSDGNILWQNATSMSTNSTATDNPSKAKMPLTERSLQESNGTCTEDSLSDYQRIRDGNSYSRFMPLASRRKLHCDCSENQPPTSERLFQSDQQGIGGGLTKSNLIDVDWLSSSGNSCEEDACERWVVTREMRTNSSASDITNALEINDLNIDCGQGSEIDKSDRPIMERTDCNGTLLTESGLEEIKESDCTSGENQDAECLSEFSTSFAQWVFHGQTLCH